MDSPFDRATRVSYEGNGRRAETMEPSIGELLKRLSADSAHLVRQEIILGKTELRETGAQIAKVSSRLAIALLLGVPGVSALAAFVVIALGDAMDNYWASSLIVGVVLVVTAIIIANRAIATITRGRLGAPRTAETLREDARWAKDEARTFKQELKR